ncbi:MAG: hypothetical protein AB1942_17790 [Pseudomonadota bacterium]
MKPEFAIIAAACVALAACSPAKKDDASAVGGAKFSTNVPMSEYMGHVVDPAAFLYWHNSGSDITAEGEKERYPTTDEGWDVLVTGATTLIEAGNTLQLPHRVRQPAADWNKYAQLLSERATTALAAAEKHDKQAVFEEGGKLYEVCVACHEQFVIEPQLESSGPAEGDPLPKLPQKK